jgi:hypothetical protein
MPKGAVPWSVSGSYKVVIVYASMIVLSLLQW